MLQPLSQITNETSKQGTDERGPRSQHPPGPAASPFSLTEFLQLSELTKKSARIEILLEAGSSGHLEVVEGDVWNAEVELVGHSASDPNVGLWTGEEAIAIILSSVHRVDSVTTLEVRPSVRQIRESTSSLLLNAAVISDHDSSGIDPNTSGHLALQDIKPSAIETIRRRCEEEVQRLPRPALIALVDPLTSSLIQPVVSDQQQASSLVSITEQHLDRICACLEAGAGAGRQGAQETQRTPQEVILRIDGIQCLVAKLPAFPLALLVATRHENCLVEAHDALTALASRVWTLLLIHRRPEGSSG